MNYNEVYNELNRSQLIYISQPDHTVSIGVSKHNTCPNNDSLLRDKVLTIQHYGTITSDTNTHYTFNMYVKLKGYNVMLKTFMVLLSFLIMVYDYYVIKYRVNCIRRGMIQKLRNAHVYMSDTEIIQTVYSFMLVYIGGSFAYGITVLGCVVEEKKCFVWMCMNVLLFMIIYNGMEVIIKEHNVFALVVRLIAFVGFKLWFRVKCEIDEVGAVYPGYGDYML